MNFTHGEIARPSRRIRCLGADKNEFDWSGPSSPPLFRTRPIRLPRLPLFFLRGVKYRPPLVD